MVRRVADEVVLSDEERAFLKAQVRRNKAATSLSDRCRMIRLCADVRYGTTSLFAPLDIRTGAVIGKCYKGHRASEFLDFLQKIEAAVPKVPDVHLVMDNYATHKTPKIKACLVRRSHWYIHITPTSASWINQVVRWFAKLSREKLQRSVHRSTAELEADILAFIEAHNENPKPYRWVKSADEILASAKRFCKRTQQTLCNEL